MGVDGPDGGADSTVGRPRVDWHGSPAPKARLHTEEILTDPGGGGRTSGMPEQAARLPHRWVPVLVLVAGFLILGWQIRVGWVPHDEGFLGQSAERVLWGEVPHRDFTEIYTGLLSYLHAGVFAVLPISSLSLRLPLFFATLVWLWATYRILLRFLPGAWAGAAAVTALVWAVPNYPSPLPSWYILFAATFCAFALIRWVEERRGVYLNLAGFWSGVAFLLKLSGVFVILGGGLALIALSLVGGDRGMSPRQSLARWVVAIVPLGAAVILVVMVTTGDREFVRFAFPTSLLLFSVAARSFRRSSGEGWGTGGDLAGALTSFVLGAAVPVAVYAVFQAFLGGLHPMLRGVFITPLMRTEYAFMRPPSLVLLLFAIPLVVLLWLPPGGRRASRISLGFAALWFTIVLVLSRTSIVFYQFGWMSAWFLLLFVAVNGAHFVLVRHPGRHCRQGDSAIVLVCVAVATALLEYPFAAPIYVLYAFPLTFLAAVALVRISGRPGGPVQAVILFFFFAFGLFRGIPLPLTTLGIRYEVTEAPEQLDLPRGGLLVPPNEARGYRELVTLVRNRSAGRPVWAGPEAPEVYFLSGVQNHTGTLFDIFDPADVQAEPLTVRLDALGAAVVVLNLLPEFSPPLSDASIDSVRVDFPNERRILKYLVLWR